MSNFRIKKLKFISNSNIDLNSGHKLSNNTYMPSIKTKAVYRYYKKDSKLNIVKEKVYVTRYISTIDTPYGKYELE